jgi:hypothetical protein
LPASGVSSTGWRSTSSRRSATSSGVASSRRLDEHHELVAAEAPDGVAVAHGRPAVALDLDPQQLVAGGVAEGCR